MVANKNNAVYRCENKYHVTRERKCDCGDTVSIDVVDSIAWGLACNFEIKYIFNFSKEQIKIWENDVKLLRLKIDNSDKQYETIKAKKIKRYLVDVPDATIEEQTNHANRSTRQDKQRIEQEKTGYQIEINRLNGLIKETACHSRRIGYYEKEPIPATIIQSNDSQRYDIIHKYIKEIIILQEPNIKGTKRIVVKFFDHRKEDEIFFYNGRVKDKSKRLYQTGGAYIDFFRYIDYNNNNKNEITERYNKTRVDTAVDGRWYYDYSTRFERKKKVH